MKNSNVMRLGNESLNLKIYGCQTYRYMWQQVTCSLFSKRWKKASRCNIKFARKLFTWKLFTVSAAEPCVLKFVCTCCSYLFLQFFVYFQIEHFDDQLEVHTCRPKLPVTEMAIFLYCLTLVTLVIPLIIIIHNYARVSYTLVKSMKQNAKLMEGNQQE